MSPSDGPDLDLIRKMAPDNRGLLYVTVRYPNT